MPAKPLPETNVQEVRTFIQGAHAGLTKSYICFSICKALQSLILGYFHTRGLSTIKSNLVSSLSRALYVVDFFLKGKEVLFFDKPRFTKSYKGLIFISENAWAPCYNDHDLSRGCKVHDICFKNSK